MREIPIPNPRFTGIFIPAEILEIAELSPNEIILLAWIDALQSKEYGGCFAGNEYLGKRLSLMPDTIQKMISKLKSFDLVRQVSFNGRTRILITYTWFSQSEADQEKNPGQTRKNILVRPGEKSDPTYIYNKEENKEYISPLIPQRGNEKKSDIISSSVSDNIYPVAKSQSKSKVKDPPESKIKFLDHILLTEEQYQKLLKQYGEQKLKAMLESLDSYIGSNNKKYTSHFDVLKKNGWVEKQYEKDKLIGQKYANTNKNAVQNIRDSINKRWVDANGNPDDDPNILDFSK